MYIVLLLHPNHRDRFAIYALSLLSDQVTASYSKLLESISCASFSNVVIILLYYLCPTLQMSIFRFFNFAAILGVLIFISQCQTPFSLNRVFLSSLEVIQFFTSTFTPFTCFSRVFSPQIVGYWYLFKPVDTSYSLCSSLQHSPESTN